jgi:S-adenosylmethionine:tRNA ribosyltransferase-isomerase
MRVSDFDYELPEDRIAQHPLERRDRSRLMVLDRITGDFSHRSFHELPELLRPGDAVILNDTKVLPARLLGRKGSGGLVELLLLERGGEAGGNPIWRCLIQASRKPAHGMMLHFEGGLQAEVLGREEEEWLVELKAEGGHVGALLERIGKMPLPPYIKRPEGEPAPVNDRERYQTVYAKREGAVAAPTAGLHFSADTLDALRARGVSLAYLTLHVGLGTFQPVRVNRVEEHRIHDEWFDLPQEAVAAVARARERGGRVVAVGTTVVRALEFCAAGEGRVSSRSGRCDLFIYPGYQFQVVDVMLTNFHLPRSTLLMLVSAYAGRKRLLSAYAAAITAGYRFYSYGDAMIIGSWD